MGVIFFLLALTIGGGFLVVRILSKRFCDMCSTSAICRRDNGFNLCRKCAHVAETSSMPIGDLIAQAMVTRNTAGAIGKSSSDDLNSLIGVVFGVFAGFFLIGYLGSRPESVADKVQRFFNADAQLREKLIGQWLLCDPNNSHSCAKLSFERDGTCVISISALEFRGTWAVTNGRLKTQIEDGNLTAAAIVVWKAMWGESIDMNIEASLQFFGDVGAIDGLKMERLGAPPK